MPDSKSSGALRRFELAGIAVLLAAISITAAWWCFSHGYTLYYGDAEAHLNIARRVLDSRTPGVEQLGTVWLPLPHILMLPFVHEDAWWKNGNAGVIPSAACFLIAGIFLFLAAKHCFGSIAAGLLAALLFALNPNMLYLQSTPMTEPVFAAALAALLWSTLWFRDSQSIFALIAAGIASNAASLTRYEGWFLIPFVAGYVLIVARTKWHVIVFVGIAALGPLAWLAHNQYYYSNALEFYNGPYSAMAIYKRQLAEGMMRYPGDHDWRKAIEYFLVAVQATSGWFVVAAGLTGAILAILKKIWWPIVLLALPSAFYIWGMHSGGIPIYVPQLWPNTFYNTRYGLAALPLLAFASGGTVTYLNARLRIAISVAVVVAAGVVSTLTGEPICWKESELNSIARRQWTTTAAEFLRENYKPGSGVIYSFGDLTGVLRSAGIPLKEGLHEGNMPYWDAAVIRPEVFLREQWAIVFSGDPVATAILRSQRHGPRYILRRQIIVKRAPVIEIYQRQLDRP